jgi:hypothetical protein
MATIRLDVFGRFQVDLVRENEGWVVVRVGQGLGAPLDVVIPSELQEDEAIRHLEDLWHEAAVAGQRIRKVRSCSRC